MNNPIYVVAHLYDLYGTFLIGLTTKEKANKYRYYNHAQYSSEDVAIKYVRMRLDKIEEQSKTSYNQGYKLFPKQSRKAYSCFLKDIFRNELNKIGYNGWIEIA